MNLAVARSSLLASAPTARFDLKGEARLPQESQRRPQPALSGARRRNATLAIAQGRRAGSERAAAAPSLLDAPGGEAPAGEIR
jgi:hypothetical protein